MWLIGLATKKNLADNCLQIRRPQHSDFEIVARKHEQAQDPNFHF